MIDLGLAASRRELFRQLPERAIACCLVELSRRHFFRSVFAVIDIGLQLALEGFKRLSSVVSCSRRKKKPRHYLARLLNVSGSFFRLLVVEVKHPPTVIPFETYLTPTKRNLGVWVEWANVWPC